MFIYQQGCSIIFSTKRVEFRNRILLTKLHQYLQNLEKNSATQGKLEAQKDFQMP